MLRNNWNRVKAIEVVLYLLERLETKRRRVTVVCEILYQGDKLHQPRHGRLICDDDYVAVHSGMQPYQTYQLIIENRSDAFHFGGRAVVPRRPSDIMQLSRTDTKCLDDTLELYGRSSRRKWRGGVMDRAWHVASRSGAVFKEDPFRRILVSLPELAQSLPNATEIVAHLQYLSMNYER